MDLSDRDNEPSSLLMGSTAASYPTVWAMESLAKTGVEGTGLWPQDDCEDLAMPKVEAMDDDLDMSLLNQLPTAGIEEGVVPKTAEVKPKRPRGRPRKHPLTPIVNTNKVTKGRSKTGCITCRKRKKKCDEAKPRCMNCEKNAVVCEGYHEKQIWKSGKERAEEARLRRESLPVITMQPLFHGMETLEDSIFWKHYCNHLSNVLTVEGEHRNAFKDIVLQIATRHKGLMHSILALSSKHIDYATPYGAKVLQDNPETSIEALQTRADFHHEESMKCFYDDISKSNDKDDAENTIILTARYGQMLCLLLQTLVEGNPRGEHRVHLQAYKNLIKHSPPEDPGFLSFITEFFEYHTFADELLAYPSNSYGLRCDSLLDIGEWPPEVGLHPPRLIGVTDGLFGYMRRITGIRNTIRANMATNAGMVVDYESLYHSAEINASIRSWMPHWPPGDSRDRVSLLYKQTMWVYLFQTVNPPTNSGCLPALWNSPEGLVDTTAIDSQVPPSPVSSSVDPHTGELRRRSCPSPSTSISGAHDVCMAHQATPRDQYLCMVRSVSIRFTNNRQHLHLLPYDGSLSKMPAWHWR
ncbi:unnamed protein product [Parascedosporium putredinis]|uniref:Zn(2)-C6 fungal-type domain-containing protein n=1 Tax=Parascedosporium putredinis TaxID=1442378 RepID=A0A9P1H7P6_9PEZI|nr:unnamed protein product [Parascedosporium putredinis]CAI8000044.1 unnamed protein product [Parascedosporium putredinis]